MSRRIAVIDCGTNTFHLLIKETPSNKVLHREKIPVRIGEGGLSNNTITKEAMTRGIKALTSFNETLGSLDVEKCEAVGTSAFRSATNSKEIKELIFKQTGIDIKIISGDSEAQLIYEGVRSAVTMGNETSYLIMDIGGGSVEFIIANVGTVLWKQSFEIGGRRLLDKFHKSDPISINEVLRLESFLEESLSELWLACAKHKPQTLIGASGSFDSLVEIYHSKNNMLFVLEDNTEYKLPTSDYNRIHNTLVSLSHKERINLKGLIEMRAEMIVVASLLIKYTLDKTNIQEILTSTYALKEGVIERIKNNEVIS